MSHMGQQTIVRLYRERSDAIAIARELAEAGEGMRAVLKADTVGTIYMDDPRWYQSLDVAVDRWTTALARARKAGIIGEDG